MNISIKLTALIASSVLLVGCVDEYHSQNMGYDSTYHHRMRPVVVTNTAVVPDSGYASSRNPAPTVQNSGYGSSAQGQMGGYDSSGN